MGNPRPVEECLRNELSDYPTYISVGAVFNERRPVLGVKSLIFEMVIGKNVKNVSRPRKATFGNMTAYSLTKLGFIILSMVKLKEIIIY